MLCFKTI